MQLFNSLDPSPFRERDLDPHTEDFVVGWARELPLAAPFTIVVELPPEEAAKSETYRIAEAFSNYFSPLGGGRRPRPTRAVSRRLALASDWRLRTHYLPGGKPSLH
jgi:hypothetical protein